MNTILKWTSLGILTATLFACGGGGSFNSSGSGSGGGGSGGGTTTVELGSGNGSSFKNGVLAIAAPSLSAGGTTTVTAVLQNSDGTAYTQSGTIAFSSPCAGGGTASFSPASVTTTSGVATTTYAAKGCSGQDPITASATVGSSNLTATGIVNIGAANVGSIQFISANPPQISLAGTGGTETSTVIFEVTDVTGDPVSNATVNFSLDTTVGGIVITPTSAVSGPNGQVQTILQAGTQHGSVRVIATTTTSSGTQIQTESTGIVISTGIPTEDNFSLSIATHDTEGGSIDGIKDAVQVILSDRFNNPVPDGTTVSFTTNGGQIGPSCITGSGAAGTSTGPGSGACTVSWISAAPRPGSGPLSVSGHAEILAYATGEESFTDTNGDGVFDDNDQFSLYSGSGPGDTFFPGPAQDDIGEVYMDQNESGAYVSGDYFFDFNKDGVRNLPDHTYHGAGCKGTPTVPCAPTPTLGIGKQDCIIMATSQLVISGPSSMSPGATATFFVKDLNANAPPAKTTFAIAGLSGASASILNITAADTPCSTSEPGTYPGYAVSVNVPSTSAAGSFVISATSPSGLVSYSNTITVP
ncbi:MAG: Ig-like domain-containing protein [Gammaproteobacteria bacterium]